MRGEKSRERVGTTGNVRKENRQRAMEERKCFRCGGLGISPVIVEI